MKNRKWLMFDLQYIRFGVKDDMIEKHVVKRKRSAVRIYTCVRKGTSGSQWASESVPLYISVNYECTSSWHRQTCQTVQKVCKRLRVLLGEAVNGCGQSSYEQILYGDFLRPFTKRVSTRYEWLRKIYPSWN
jgi:hypothetical protein